MKTVRIEPAIEIELPLVANVTLGYPPPDVQDHDHPGFSDPGSGDDVDFIRLDIDKEKFEALRKLTWGSNGVDVAPFQRIEKESLERFVWDILRTLVPSLDDKKELEDRFLERAHEDSGYEDKD